MAERRTIKDAMTPEKLAFIRETSTKDLKPSSDEKLTRTLAADIEVTRTSPSENPEGAPATRRGRERTRDNRAEATDVLDKMLVPVTLRLHHRTAQTLKRAYLEQKLKFAKPDTLQDIGEEALVDWLKKRGYFG